MNNETQVDNEFADSVSHLVDMLLPDARAEERLYAEAAFAKLALCTVMETVMQLDNPGHANGFNR